MISLELDAVVLCVVVDPRVVLGFEVAVFHIEDRTDVLLEVVVVPVPLLAERTLHRIVSEVNVEDVSLVLPLGGEFLAAVLAGVHGQGGAAPQHGIGAHLARQPLKQLMLVLELRVLLVRAHLVLQGDHREGVLQTVKRARILGGQLFNIFDCDPAVPVVTATCS